ncbi:hypothetical protein DRE_00771 [Drechslerella stenobrocha 248]|uniref:Uncharacterized protein n=1 Tax=Drechslerella stenobrocha 248 TaxID=1043628 RepID=W7HYV7_9PEZI|nr:hypothetical protein DRE_00771 [Drechslerella stenobrocha 248]
MAEVLGVVASGLQLAEVALKTGTAIYKFVDTIRSAPRKTAAFRRDLDSTLGLLKGIKVLLGVAQVDYKNVGETAILIRDTIDNFHKELADILKTIETIYGNPTKSRWRTKLLIGLKGDSEWVRIEASMTRHYHRLNAASAQLSIKLSYENGERINNANAVIKDIETEITDNVSAPICSMQEDIRTVIRAEDTSISFIQESMALQRSHMARTEQLYGHQFQRIEELHDTVITNQDVNSQSLCRIEVTCAENKTDIRDLKQTCQSVADTVLKMKDDLKGGGDVTHQNITAVVAGLQSLHGCSANNSYLAPTSREERKLLEKGKRKLSLTVRRLVKLTEDPSPKRVLKGHDAEEFTNCIQELLDTLQDESSVGNGLKNELAKLTDQLLNANSVYMMQNSPDSWVQKKIETARNVSNGLLDFDCDSKMGKQMVFYEKTSLEDGTLLVSSAYEKRIENCLSDDRDEMEVARTVVRFNPVVKPGETKAGLICESSRTFGTKGDFSVPLLLRVYNKRFYDIWDNDSPRNLAAYGNLARLQELFSARLISIYDTDELGQSLLHTALDSLRSRADTKRTADCFKVCQFLLKQGADANLLDDEGTTAIGHLGTSVFEDYPTYIDVEITKSTFKAVLDSAVSDRSSRFGPEHAIASSVRELMGGSSWFFDELLSKLSTTDFDINNYSGCNNAIMLELAVADTRNYTCLLNNCDIAVKYGGDIRARTWNTDESCLHLLLHKIVFPLGDKWVKSEAAWVGYKGHLVKGFLTRFKKMMELGADVYAVDEIDIEFLGGRHVKRSVTRAMYLHEVQDIWWETISSPKFGHSKSKVLEQEASDIGVSAEEYEASLNQLAKRTFDERQRYFQHL